MNHLLHHQNHRDRFKRVNNKVSLSNGSHPKINDYSLVDFKACSISKIRQSTNKVNHFVPLSAIIKQVTI